MNEATCLKCELPETACYVSSDCPFTPNKKLVQIGPRYDKRTKAYRDYRKVLLRAEKTTVNLEEPVEWSGEYRAWVRSVLLG